MEKMQDVLKAMNNTPLYPYREPFEDPNPIFTEWDFKIVNKLFVTFQSIFPAFRHAWPQEADFDNAKREWMKAFKQGKISDVEIIKRGVNRYRLLPSPFVPSPGQFIEMCKPSPDEFGLKSLEEAFKEACYISQPSCINKQFSHPSIRLACHLTGSFFLCNNARSKTYPIFEKNYHDSMKQFMDGRILQQVEFKPAEIEPALKNLEEYKKLRSHVSAMAKIKEILK